MTLSGLAAAATFIWFGMVAAISFLEAPLKFRAPGITVALGLGVGRLVFHALNIAETALAVVLLIALVTRHPGASVVVLAAIAMACLAIQMTLIRPPLDRRAAIVIAGGEPGPSGSTSDTSPSR